MRAKITKAVGRPADIYSLGALFYYLVSGAYANPKALYDNFRKFIEYERKDKTDTVRAYIDHEYSIIQNLRAPRNDEERVEVAPEDRFFSYKQYLDGGGELIDKEVMYIVARAMIRNKPDSYCKAWDLDTQGITEMVGDLMALYVRFGVNPSGPRRPPAPGASCLWAATAGGPAVELAARAVGSRRQANARAGRGPGRCGDCENSGPSTVTAALPLRAARSGFSTGDHPRRCHPRSGPRALDGRFDLGGRNPDRYPQHHDLAAVPRWHDGHRRGRAAVSATISLNTTP